jgi:hypothetical protein
MSNISPSDSEDSDTDDKMWDTDNESDIEDEDYFEAWEAQPVPQTYEERVEEKAKKRERKHRIAEMHGVEHREAGSTNNHKKGASLYYDFRWEAKHLSRNETRCLWSWRLSSTDYSREEESTQG